MFATRDTTIAGTSTASRVTSAIAEASRKTGVDFDYLMNQAKIESSMNPNAKARTSSATGLYQFIDQSWLAVMDKHGAENGMGWAADAIKQGSNGRYYVADPEVRQQILNLRKNPEVASLMAAEHAADNKAYLERKLGREASSTDLYLAHFLGVGGASKFLAAHDANPDADAASILPAAARANRGIFYSKSGEARSFAEIRTRFAKKLGNAGDIQMAGNTGNSVPNGQTVQPADYVRIEQARLSSRSFAATQVQPETARLAYLMLATFGR